MDRQPAPRNAHEELFALHVRASKLPAPQREHRFHPERAWRLDFAWPDLMLAVEIEGGVHGRPCKTCGDVKAGGRHTRGDGFAEDCRKYAEAMLLGWKVLRVTTEMVSRGEAIALTQRMMEVGRS